MKWFTRWLTDNSPSTRPTRQLAKLQSEELEVRWNPASSTNWSGYAVTGAAGSVTAVSGQWTVPTVTGTGNQTTYSSVWVGIDGDNSSTVEQTGIEADVVNGVAYYSAWYEMYPAAPVTINIPIHAGDKIAASVTYSNSTGKFTLTLTDLSDSGNNTFTTTQSASGAQRSSAEWIVEAPSSNTGVLPLANFGTATITNASATISGITGPINASAWANTVTPINMVSSTGVTLATTSVLNSTGTGFTVTYGAAVSPPPVSPPPVSPPPVSPPPVSPPPAPSSISTTTTMTGSVVPNSWVPTVLLTVKVSPTVPVGSKVALLYNGHILGYGYVQNIQGVEMVQFAVSFSQVGSYTFSAEYMGSGKYAASYSNPVTVNITSNSTQQRDSWWHHQSSMTASIAPPPVNKPWQ